MSLGSRSAHWWGQGSWDAGIGVQAGSSTRKGAPRCSSLRLGRGGSCHLELGPRAGPRGGAHFQSLVSWASQPRPSLYNVLVRGCLPLQVPGPLRHGGGMKNRCLSLGFRLLNNISEEAALKEPHWQHPCLRPRSGRGSEPGHRRGEPLCRSA